MLRDPSSPDPYDSRNRDLFRDSAGLPRRRRNLGFGAVRRGLLVDDFRQLEQKIAVGICFRSPPPSSLGNPHDLPGVQFYSAKRLSRPGAVEVFAE
jgi:hypothetical protein